MPATRVVKLGEFYSWGNWQLNEVGAFLADFDFGFDRTRESRPFDVKAQISKDSSTRSAIGRIVTVYRVVRTVRSALEGKAHLTLPQRGRIHRLLRWLSLFHTFSELFRCAISPQFMDDNDLHVLNTSPCTFGFVGSEMGGGGRFAGNLSRQQTPVYRLEMRE